MKKRVLSVVLVLVIVLGCVGSAIGEDFKLRNGILFGDTIETIVEKETTLTRESEDSNWFKGKIAGYSNAECSFLFDDDGKMYDMTYTFGSSCTSRDSMNDVYTTLYQSLVRQYGTPLGNTGGSCHLITGNAIDRMGLFVYLFGGIDGYSGDYVDYGEWIVDCDDYHVKIDLISYYYRNSDYDYSYFCDLSYHRYTDADYNAAVKEKQGEREEVDSDL